MVFLLFIHSKLKTLFFFGSLFCIANVFAQDSLRIKQIDSLVSIIDHSDLPTQLDSNLEEKSGRKLSIKTYTTQKTLGKQLKEYSTMVKVTQREDMITTLDLSGTAFYYDDNKLIKVEEFMTRDGKENKVEWYFFNDNCFYHSLRSVRAKDRIVLLLEMSNGYLKKVIGQN